MKDDACASFVGMETAARKLRPLRRGGSAATNMKKALGGEETAPVYVYTEVVYAINSDQILKAIQAKLPGMKNLLVRDVSVSGTRREVVKVSLADLDAWGAMELEVPIREIVLEQRLALVAGVQRVDWNLWKVKVILREEKKEPL